MNKYIKLIFIFIISFIIVNSSYLIAIKFPKIATINNESIFKTKYIKPNNKIVRVEIEILDDTKKNYYDIIDVVFNNKKINLLKADASGNKARKYFQLKPGKYLIKWTITKNKKVKWPNYEKLQKTIIIKDSDSYIHILIIGNKITIS